MFDLRAVTGAEGMPTKFEMHYRASVQQSTGEDWTDAVACLVSFSSRWMELTCAQLNLSTASPDSLATRIPTLNSVKIVPTNTGIFGFKQAANQNQVPQTSAFSQNQNAPQLFGFGSSQNTNTNTQSQGLFGAALFGTATTGIAPLPPAPSGLGGQTHITDEDRDDDGTESVSDPLPQIEVPDAIASKNSMATNFQVVGQVNIRTDGSKHKVAIATLSLKSKIDQVVVPRSINGAYFHVCPTDVAFRHLFCSGKDSKLFQGHTSSSWKHECISG